MLRLIIQQYKNAVLKYIANVFDMNAKISRLRL